MRQSVRNSLNRLNVICENQRFQYLSQMPDGTERVVLDTEGQNLLQAARLQAQAFLPPHLGSELNLTELFYPGSLFSLLLPPPSQGNPQFPRAGDVFFPLPHYHFTQMLAQGGHEPPLRTPATLGEPTASRHRPLRSRGDRSERPMSGQPPVGINTTTYLNL